ncbi:DUF3649 domain-containing protein [Rhodanobacter sp. Col0626]|uniref:DUF3649 domain-containing protein n=1 Tax=Rhodanobacter sp. Col0626 TaxID=3415679 RepID=UPI003CFB724E
MDVAARALAAAVGGYLIAALTTALLPRLLPMPRSEAVITATLLSFPIYAAVVLWAFAAARVARVWRWTLAVVVVLSAGNWLAIASAGRL